MKQGRLGVFIFAAVVLFFVGSDLFFTVQENETAIVLQFGEIKKVHNSPGLKVKMPFTQSVVKFKAWLLDYNLPPIEVTAGDQKRMIVDMYTRYRIVDPLLFYQKVQNVGSAQNRLSTIVDASMRRVIGRIPLSDMLSQKRTQIMDLIQNEVVQSAKTFGVKVQDVRIIRADLPRENSEAIFNRMASERRQEAKQHRAEGGEEANIIRAEADRKHTEILAEAQKKSDILRGEGDAIATKIYADAYSQDEAFYEFSRTLEAYKNTLVPGDTTLVLNSENNFFKFFGKN
tara:strand:- start:1487 stop:2347 length:861 start_codon:yes stop_codon:yes gene_type:complete